MKLYLTIMILVLSIVQLSINSKIFYTFYSNMYVFLKYRFYHSLMCGGLQNAKHCLIVLNWSDFSPGGYLAMFVDILTVTMGRVLI